MGKINWEKVGNFIMGAIGIVIGGCISYVAIRIMIAIITSVYDVLTR